MGKLRVNGSDFFWKHADILYASAGINPSGYDERIMPFIALKVLIDYGKVRFNFDYKNHFGLPPSEYKKVKRKTLRDTFLNIVKNIEKFSNFSKSMFQPQNLNNPNSNSTKEENVIKYFLETFNFDRHIKELTQDYLLSAILDIYNEVNFKEVPKEQFKDLYESTISRMRKGKTKGFNGTFMGQHFTQSATVRLICEVAYSKMKRKNKLAIYDPACGVGMMLIESYFFFKERGVKDIEVYGQEIDQRVWLMAKIFMEALDIPNKIARGNTLTSPAFINGLNGEDSFDFIITNPPFGIDWKHEKDFILKNMQDEENSYFFVIKDENGKPVLPPQSDGQFLFMLHIIKLMLNEKKKGKEAFAGIISSSSLPYTSGKAEDTIRKQIFELGIVDTILLQPPNMFTNTSMQTCIWFLSTKKMDRKTKHNITLIRADNPELFSKHPQPLDEMKNTYSDENIKNILKLIKSRKKLVSHQKKIISVVNGEEIISRVSLSSEIPLKEEEAEDIDLYMLYLDLMEKFSCLCSSNVKKTFYRRQSENGKIFGRYYQVI